MQQHEGSTENGQKQVQVPSLGASRELDALIAGKVFGGPERNVQWYWWSRSTPSLPIDPPLYAGPHYSTDIAAAFDVLAQLGGIVTITRGKPDEWHVRIVGAPQWWAETLPLAICRAALAAVATLPSPTE